MADFTFVDRQNAGKYTLERRKLHVLKILNEKFPHIASHISYKIRKADRERDYYYPMSMENSAIVVDVTITRKTCEKISCLVATNNGNCNRSTPAHNVRIGDEDRFELACGPSCFNLFDSQHNSYDEEGNAKPQSSRFRWSKKNNRCEIPPTMTFWMEFPYYRSKEIYQHRVNDLQLGFNYDEDADTYRFNKYYCEVFFENFDPEKKNCYTSWGDKVAGIIIGDNIVKMAKAGITMLENGFQGTMPKVDLSSPPEPEPYRVLPGWRSDVDSSFVTPDPDVGLDGNKIDFNVTPDNLMGRGRVKRSADLEPSLLKDLLVNVGKGDGEEPSGRIHHHRSKRSAEVSEFNVTVPVQVENKYNSTFHGLSERIKNVPTNEGKIISVLSLIVNEETVKAMAADVLVTKATKQMQKVGKKILIDSLPKLMAKLSSRSTVVLDRVMVSSVSTITKMVVRNVGLKIAGALCKFLATTLTAMSTGIGTVLLILQIWDVILLFWDPLGLNNKYSEDTLETMYENSKFELRSQLNTTTPELTFDALSIFLLGEEALQDVDLEMHKYALQYLNSLDVNSDGQRIDKGSPVDLSRSDIVRNTVDRAIVNLHLFTSSDFNLYEQNHLERRRFGERLGFVLNISLVVGVVFAIFKLYLLSVLALTLSVLMVTLSYLNLQFDVHRVVKF